MLTMLSTVVVVGASLILTLLCDVVILPLPDDPARKQAHRPPAEW
jgi:hypothetical protein